jgi:hypothetical protein
MHNAIQNVSTARQKPNGAKKLALSGLLALLCLSMSACTILSLADAAVSSTISVISTGVSATTSVVKAVLPSSKEAAK